MLLIFAGNYKQFKNFVKDNKLDINKVRYVDRPQKLFGVQGCDFIEVGEYWLNDYYYSDRFLDLKKWGELNAIDKKELEEYK